MFGYLKKILLTIFISLLGILLLLWSLSTKPLTTPEDEKYLQAHLQKWGIEENTATIQGNFVAELALINRIQDSVIVNLRGYNKPIPKEKVGNVRYYFEEKTGACYDRALLMEKLLARLGFQTRHIFIFFRGDGSTTQITDLFRNKLSSHALMEVKTTKGWMVIDTQNAWRGVNEKNDPLTLDDLRNRWRTGKNRDILDQNKIPAYLADVYQKGNFKFVYGLYSRHGGFLPHHNWVNLIRKWGIPVSDYNLPQIMMNLF